MAYIDGNEVWVATNDGSQRARLSAGEGDWRQVAQSDLGYVVGVQLEAGSIAQLSRFAVWDPTGNRIKSGPLGASLAGSMSYPLSLDLTPDAALIVYGFDEETFGPGGTVTKGFFVKASSDPSFTEPQRVTAARFPTLNGTRVVATQSLVMASVQNPGSTGSPSFTPWIDISGGGGELEKTDVPAAANAAAFELRYPDDSTKIALLRVQALGVNPAFPAEFDCFIAAGANPSAPSWSQDGSLIAWQDSGGVKVAGRPISTADPCVSGIATVTLSATGSFPSFGPFDVAQYLSLHQPPATPPLPTPPLPTPPLPVRPSVTAPKSIKLAALIKSGLKVKVSHPNGGAVALTLNVTPKQVGQRGTKPVTVATAKGTLPANQTKSLKLRITKTGKKLKKKLEGDKASLAVSIAGETTTQSLKLK